MYTIPDHHPQRVVKRWAKRTFFLALEDNEGAQRYLTIEKATEEEACQFAADAYKFTQYRAIYLFDQYCRECNVIGHLIDCDHVLVPACQCDALSYHIDVDEIKKGVEKHGI